ncbi:unnamed protein product [Amoebophrya sp. A25]|nr:unnamed protein product [Amoebophrya sp. A25]|eukprot:GSA25T00008633001.1
MRTLLEMFLPRLCAPILAIENLELELDSDHLSPRM